MTAHQISASALVDAPPEIVYTIIADYRHAHPLILPKPPFLSLDVEKGGTGAGTEFRAYMRVMGRRQSFRGVVTEPEPGRVLVEANDNGYTTTFTVEPRGEGRQSYVTITTEPSKPPGMLKILEARIMARLLRPVYVRELAQLAEVAATRRG